MNSTETINQMIYAAFQARLGARLGEFQVPPPSFTRMAGEFVALDLEAGRLAARFPVRESYQNAYGSMQGGFLAAAVDNVLGPLSMLLAPPNLTRHLELTYSYPVTLETGWIRVEARLIERAGQRLHLRADVLDPAGRRLARAKATHWILDE